MPQISNDQNAIIFDNVKFSYPASNTYAVNGVSLSIRKGEFVSIIGHNGSGKSTLARLANGLLDADSGKITVLGLDIDNSKNLLQVRKHVGIVFQNPDNQMVASIVEDDIAFGAENIGIPREEIGKRIDWALNAVGMQEFRTSTPTRLSGGQKQRIAIAGVLAVKPEILILDESTAMLDPKGRGEVIEVVKKLNKEEGITVILITHFLQEALIADRTIVMNKGEIALQGTPNEIFEKGEELETFNLTLPKITQIINALNSNGLHIKNTLQYDELAKDIYLSLKDKTFSTQKENNKTNQTITNNEWNIDIQNLTFTYSKKSPFAKKALNNINLHISEGEFFGIIGHTGSGKSTLIQHLNALIKLPQVEKGYRQKRAKKGQTITLPNIKIGEFDLSNKKTNFKNLRASVGMVFQYPEYQLFAESVFLDVAFGLKNFNKNLTSEEIEKAVKESIEIVGLDYNEVKDKSPFDLSGGQKRRVAIAGVIVTKPKILILDEPAAGLDPLGKKEIDQLLHTLHEKWCKTVIIVSHDMDEIAENCTNVAVISKGEVVLSGTPCNIFSQQEKIYSLGLDLPLTSKLCNELNKLGVQITCDCTTEDFVNRVVAFYKGGANA